MLTGFLKMTLQLARSFVLFCNQSRIFSNFIIPISCRDLQSEKGDSSSSSSSPLPRPRLSGSICVIDDHERQSRGNELPRNRGTAH